MAPLDEGLFRMFLHVGDLIVKHDHQQQFWSQKITQNISKCISMLIATQLHEPNKNGTYYIKSPTLISIYMLLLHNSGDTRSLSITYPTLCPTIVIIRTIPRNATTVQHKLYPHKNECNHDQKGIKCSTLPTHSSIDQILHVMYQVKASCSNRTLQGFHSNIRNFYSLCSNGSLPCSQNLIHQGP